MDNCIPFSKRNLDIKDDYETFRNKILYSIDSLLKYTCDKLTEMNMCYYPTCYDDINYIDLYESMYNVYIKINGLHHTRLLDQCNQDTITETLVKMEQQELIDFLDFILYKEHFEAIMKNHYICMGEIDIMGYNPNKYIDSDKINTLINEIRSTWIAKINEIFVKSILNYKFDTDMNQIVPIFNEYINESLDNIKNNIFKNKDFDNVSDDFRAAYTNLYKENYIDCIINIAKAFESTLKIVCIKLNYTNDNSKTFGTYLDALRKNNFYGELKMVGDGIEELVRSIDKVLPNIRNKNGGHGQGVDEHVKDRELTEYAFFAGINAMNLIINIYNKRKIELEENS